MNPIFLKSLICIVIGGGIATTSYGAYSLFSSKTIKDELIKQELNPLNTVALENTSQIDLNENWNKLVNKLIDRNGSETRIITITSTQKEQKDENKKNDINALKAKCSELFNKKYSTSESQDYKNSKDWCTTSSINK